MGDHILPRESFEMQERRVDPLPSVPNPEENNRRSDSVRRVRFVIPPDEFFDDDFPPEVVVTREELERELEKHCHDVKRKKIVDYKCPRKKTMNAIGICGVFIVGEALGGYLAGSLAVAADACRMFGDFAGLMATLVTLYMVNDSPTKSRNFGYGRVEIIGAVASMVISWIVSAILICLSIYRFLLAEPQIDVLIMMTTSGIGFVENIILGMTLHQDIRRPWNVDPKREARLVDSTGTSLATMCVSNITIRAAMRHVFQGALHSLGVFTAAVVVSVKPEWVAADLICTILFSIASICSSIGLTKRILNVLMEGVPDGIDYEKVRGALLKMQGVLAIHNLRMWSLSMANTAVSVHLVIGPGNNVNNSVLREALKELKCRFGFFEATVQIEEFKPSMDACKMCHEFDE